MKSRNILLFMAFVIALLGLTCAYFPRNGINVGDLNIHFPSLSKILNPQRQIDVEAYLAKQDSITSVMQNRQDSIDRFQTLMDSSDIRFWFPDGDNTFFDALFAQMEGCQQSGRIIRILHYGDSQIEMDRMSNRLRSYMQRQFGGGGPGLVPYKTLISSLSVGTHGSGNLIRQSPFGDSTVVRAQGNYGPMVQDFRVVGSASSRIVAATHKSCDSRLRQFSQFKMLFCNRPGPLTATLNDLDGGYSQEQYCEEDGVHAFTWHLDSASSQVRISLSGTADIYGIMVDDGPGVAVDNIPMRGCSGHQFTQINQQKLADAYSQMDVGLIIMQFGGNSVPYLKSQKSIDNYCNELGKQIERLRQCCPQALILFIGPSDMSTRVGGELQSYPLLPQIVEKLQQMANAHGAAYWSIYRAMGGYNSMVAWNQQGLSGSDYLHFTQHGADIMGDRLSKAFDNMYKIYTLRKGLQHE